MLIDHVVWGIKKIEKKVFRVFEIFKNSNANDHVIHW
jgi:hypothetical protein